MTFKLSLHNSEMQNDLKSQRCMHKEEFRREVFIVAARD